MKSQGEQILAALKSGRAITPMHALREFGCLRTAARIAELRQAGYRITTERLTVKTRDGRATVARYRLADAN